MKIRKCTVCGREFESHNGREVCSESCFLERKRKWEKETRKRKKCNQLNDPITYTCAICGRQFDGMRQKYCSDECRAIGRKQHVDENNKYYRTTKKNMTDLNNMKE